MGSGQGKVWRARLHLRNDRVIADRFADKRAALDWHRDLPGRTSANFRGPTDHLPGRGVSGNSFGCLRIMGNLRAGPVPARARWTGDGALVWLATAVPGSDYRNRFADRWRDP